jgi:hypothetical protein
VIRTRGIVVYLPLGGEVSFLFRLDGFYQERGPLAVAALAQRACARAGFFTRQDDCPLREDVPTLRAAGGTFLYMLDAPAKTRIELPDGCAWIVDSDVGPDTPSNG